MAKNSALNFGEIVPTNPDHVKAWRYGMDWARIELSHNDLKDEFVSWAENNNLENVQNYQSLPSWQYVTLGRMAYLINRGAIPPESTIDWFMKKVGELPTSVPVESDSSEEETPLTSKARKVIDYVNLYSFMEAVLHRFREDGEKIEEMITDRLRRSAPNSPMLKKLYDHFKESLAESINEKDNPYVEQRIAPLILTVNILAAATGNAKIVSKNGGNVSRKVAKATEKIAYKAMDADTNMASVNPSQVPGTKTAVVYNSKNRKIMVYHAKTNEQLDIKGTKIVNFDESTSFAKTLRKPKVLLPMLRNAVTVRRIELLFDDIKGKNHSVNGRIGKEMIIVKVLK